MEFQSPADPVQTVAVKGIIPALTLCAAPLQAQIYADIAVSQGDNSLGVIRIQLEHEKTPTTVASFIGLATGELPWINGTTGKIELNKPFYDGLIFHRLIHSFVIQGGDQLGTGSGNPGYIFQDEIDPTVRHDGRYKLSMANSGLNSNGSQFFITLRATPELDDKHTVFGEVINDDTYPNSRAIIDGFTSMTNFPTGAQDRPDTPITMTSVTISGPDLASFNVTDPSRPLPKISAIPFSLRARTGDGELGFNIIWEKKPKHDYPLFYTDDLQDWFIAGGILSMDTEAEGEISISNLNTELEDPDDPGNMNRILKSQGFANLPAVDYSHVVEAPQLSVLTADGAKLAMTYEQGTITLNFNGSLTNGSWTFDDGSSTSFGNFDRLSITNTNSFPLIGETGTSVRPGGGASWARFLTIRQLTAFLDGSVGTSEVTAVQPTLSFHTPTSGWFDGGVNAALNVTFRGTFTFTPAP